jgi:hypothetical protein
LGEWTARHHAAAGDFIDRIASGWVMLPRWARQGAIAGAIVLAVGLLSIRMIGGNAADPAAGTLEGRTGALIAAVAAGDRGIVQSLSNPSTAHSLPDWIERVRKVVAPLAQPDASEPHIRVVVKNEQAGVAVVKAIIPLSSRTAKKPGAEHPKPPAKPASPKNPGKSSASHAAPGHEIVTYWTLDRSGNWLFDATRTLAETPGK